MNPKISKALIRFSYGKDSKQWFLLSMVVQSSIMVSSTLFKICSELEHPWTLSNPLTPLKLTIKHSGIVQPVIAHIMQQTVLVFICLLTHAHLTSEIQWSWLSILVKIYSCKLVQPELTWVILKVKSTSLLHIQVPFSLRNIRVQKESSTQKALNIKNFLISMIRWKNKNQCCRSVRKKTIRTAKLK